MKTSGLPGHGSSDSIRAKAEHKPAPALLPTFQVVEAQYAQENTCVILTFKMGDLRSSQVIRMLEKDLIVLAEKMPAKHVVLDLTGVKIVPTAILGLILQLAVDCKGKGAICRLCCLEVGIHRAFDLLNVKGMVNIFNTCNEAVQAVWEKKSWWPF